MNLTKSLIISKISEAVILFVIGFVTTTLGQTIIDPCQGQADLAFVPKKGSCRELFQCVNGFPVLRSCPDKLFFDPINLVCTYPAWSHCEEGVPSPPTTVEPEEFLCPTNEISFLPHPDACNKYYVCAGIDTTPKEYECKDDYHFSADQLQCVPKELANCKLGVTCPGDLAEGEMIYIAHPTDCTAYFVCMNGQQLEFSCQNDLAWNDLVDSCDYKDNVVC